jgi:transposase
MDLLNVIRRWHFRQGIPIREIKRRTGLSRNTIRKYLRADTVEPVFKVPDRPSKLDPFAEKLTGWLRVEAGKSRKQKRTAKQLHADLVALGYDGSYTRVAAFARDWKRERQYEQQTRGRGIFDNMKIAVDKIGRGKARQVNARFAALASHYLFETDFCNPASGWEKGGTRRTLKMPATACGSP